MVRRHTRREFIGGLGALTACGTDGLVEPPLAEPQPYARAGHARPPSRAEILRTQTHPAIGPLHDLGEAEHRLFVHPAAFTPLAKPEPGSWRHRFDEPSQSYPEYVVSVPNSPHGQRNRLYLLPLGTFPQELVVEPVYVVLVRAPELPWLASYIECFYGLPTTVMDSRSLDALDIPARDYKGHLQLDAQALLSTVQPWLPADAYSMTAILHRDLYVYAEQQYAFGYGLHRGRLATMSVAHFDPIFTGHARSDTWRQDIDRRSLAVLTHEVGHTLGMRHCGYYKCVMNGMATPEEIDQTPLHLCPICLRKLDSLRVIDPLVRYERLAAFYDEAQMRREATWVRWRIDHVLGRA